MQKIFWAKTESQKKRFREHEASVVISEDGSLEFKESSIITPKGKEKLNRLISVIPKETEKKVDISSVSYLFQELKTINVLLTNACNLSCSYCYEQHNKDFGRFTNESLLETYRFLVNSNNRQKKVFQFFGGEPLIHKDVILDFLEKNKIELNDNAKGDFNTTIGIITNGLLLTKELIDQYLSYDFTYMMVSLDTNRSEVDHREIGQENIDELLEKIKYITDEPKQQKRITIRCTLSRENAPFFVDFVEKLYERGIRKIVVHPLVLDSSRGFILWGDEEWKKLHSDILYVLDTFPELTIQFSEGVGKKGEENCMIGSDMIAIDASGDFSGCYFFTNQKSNFTSDTILGNLFQKKIYIDRYKKFQTEYSKMFEVEEQCKTCDYKNSCYQCPAGNLDTGSRMFRPDDMCQKIVKLFIDLQEDVTKKQVKKKYDIICDAVNTEGENISFSKGLSYLLFFNYFNYHPKTSLVHDENIYDIDDYRKIVFLWKTILQNEKQFKLTPEKFTQQISSLLTDDVCELDEFYYYLLERKGLEKPSKFIKASNSYQKSFYLCLMHMLILYSDYNPREENFSENLVYENCDTCKT